MKNPIKPTFLASALFFLLACNGTPPKPSVYQSETDRSVITVGDGLGYSTYDLQEMEYKGHTYVFCRVRDGIALTHAGHCKCNNKK